MKKRPYIHPSQGDSARQYFEDFAEQDKRCFAMARRLALASVAIGAAGIEISSEAPLTNFVLVAGSAACFFRAIEYVFETDKNYHDKQAYISTGLEHYKVYQGEAPQWLSDSMAEVK